MFKNQGSFAHIPYWNPWRIFCGLYLSGIGMFVLYVLLCFLFEADPGIRITGIPNWQIFLISLSPIMFLVAVFSMIPYGDD